MCLLGLSLGAGLSGCKKKPSAEAPQKGDSKAVPKGAVKPTPMDAVKPTPMDAMRPTPMDAMRVWTMEAPTPDGGVVDPKGNKGMVAMKQLEDPL